MQKFHLLSLFIVFSTIGNSQDNFCEQVTALHHLIKTKHYKPKTVNDSLSKHVLHLFLKQLDPEKDFFSQTDIESFNADTFLLDDYILNTDCRFIEKYISILENRINETKNIYLSFKTKPIDYSGKLTLQYIPRESFKYSLNEEKRNLRIQKRIGFLVIKKLLEEHETTEEISKNFKTLEATAKAKIIQSEICLLDELLNKNGGITYFVKNSFLNALAKYNDPNSSYFNDSEKTTYQNALSTNQLSFGIITEKQNNGEIVISYIIPGSVAFKNGNFEAGDIIKSLKTNTSKLETYCISNEDILDYINTKGNDTITFSISKKNGTFQEITLTKTKIKVDSNVIRGYIVENNIGYIKIPSFYTNIESPNQRGLTHDLSKELYKLQKENINGLIIDLRLNGGGSMQEAIELSGMFIDRGPATIIRNQIGEILTLKDTKRGSFYNKPLLILVNEYSASASELFSCVMQDYNRAIIVGSKTYGKSSAQLILPLSETKNLGFCKLTLETFYRVTGKSHQSKGVEPDIELPSLYSIFKDKENNKPFALVNDSIVPILNHKPLPKLNLSALKTLSTNRIAKQEEFQDILKNSKALSNRLFKKGKTYHLTLNEIKEEQEKRKKLFEAFFKVNEKTYLTITNTKSTNDFLEYDTEEKEFNIKTIELLSKDIYIKEAYSILTDYIKMNNK